MCSCWKTTTATTKKHTYFISSWLASACYLYICRSFRNISLTQSFPVYTFYFRGASDTQYSAQITVYAQSPHLQVLMLCKFCDFLEIYDLIRFLYHILYKFIPYSVLALGSPFHPNDTDSLRCVRERAFHQRATRATPYPAPHPKKKSDGISKTE